MERPADSVGKASKEAWLDALSVALPRPEPLDPRLLAAARKEGRVRGIALALLAEVEGDPGHAGSRLREGLRAARALHSRERRFVADAVRDLIRYDALLRAVAGGAEGRWDAWLDRIEGIPADDPMRAALADALRADGPVAAVALVGSCDSSVAAGLVAAFGLGAGAYVAASNLRAPVVLRANTRRISPAALAERLRAAGLQTTPGTLVADALVAGNGNFEGSPEYQDGWFEIQDEGSQLLARLVAPDGGSVVDFCAGAGGKTLALADLAPDAKLLALDVRPWALDELNRRAGRAGVRVETARLGPNGEIPVWLREFRGSRVLVDAPCSGTGTWRRHPELRLRVDPTLRALQADILERASAMVAPGGRLIYGTCSVLPDENERIVQDFLAEHPEYSLLPAAEVLGAGHTPLGVTDYLRLTPQEHGTDGFFGAVLLRKG